MIHIITIHFKTPKWIDLQLKQIDKHTSDYKVWTYCDGFGISPHKHKFHFCENFKQSKSVPKVGSKNHMAKLNSLTQVVLRDVDTQDDDLLIWLDSDSFPINNVNDYVSGKMSKYPLIAINRPENDGDVIPHPSFTSTSVSFWKRHKLNWNGIPKGKLGTLDTGGELYRYLLNKNIEWYKLLRTRTLADHPLWFTIYDDLIYHHGAGSRGRHCRLDGKNRKNPIKYEYAEGQIFEMISEENFFKDKFKEFPPRNEHPGYRSKLIPLLINKINAKSYLEIGLGDGKIFKGVDCAEKYGVDPQYGNFEYDKGTKCQIKPTHQMTSDEFFKQNKKTFDVIFIDGMHEAEYAERDINNSISCLNEGGYIICHDMNPLTKESQIVPRIQNYWQGDVWKAWVNIRQSNPNICMRVIPVDCGLGIIQKGSQKLLDIKGLDITYDNLEKHREEWLNFISIEEFLVN